MFGYTLKSMSAAFIKKAYLNIIIRNLIVAVDNNLFILCMEMAAKLLVCHSAPLLILYANDKMPQTDTSEAFYCVCGFVLCATLNYRIQFGAFLSIFNCHDLFICFKSVTQLFGEAENQFERLWESCCVAEYQ